MEGWIRSERQVGEAYIEYAKPGVGWILGYPSWPEETEESVMDWFAMLPFDRNTCPVSFRTVLQAQRYLENQATTNRRSS